jgi:hypothetical protein
MRFAFRQRRIFFAGANNRPRAVFGFYDANARRMRSAPIAAMTRLLAAIERCD